MNKPTEKDMSFAKDIASRFLKSLDFVLDDETMSKVFRLMVLAVEEAYNRGREEAKINVGASWLK